MNNILALDASTRSTGWAIKAEDGTIKYGVIKDGEKDARDRILKMRDAISTIAAENEIDTIVLEEVRPDNMNSRTGQVLRWLQAAIILDIFENVSRDIQIDLIYPSSWRKVLGIQQYGVRREEYKRRDVEFANKEYSLNLSYSQDDEADALCILTAYLKDHNVIVVKDEPPKIIHEDFENKKSAF